MAPPEPMATDLAVTDPEASSAAHASPPGRALWRQVAVPTEHGGWSLTAEPVVLGLLVAWSPAGLAVGVAAMLAVLARTPLKVARVDGRRGRHLPRTTLATRIAAIELALIAVLAGAATVAAGARIWVPALAAAPLVVVQLWFDLRSRSRRLVPELAGTVGVGSAVACIALAGGASARVAVVGIQQTLVGVALIVVTAFTVTA